MELRPIDGCKPHSLLQALTNIREPVVIIAIILWGQTANFKLRDGEKSKSYILWKIFHIAFNLGSVCISQARLRRRSQTMVLPPQLSSFELLLTHLFPCGFFFLFRFVLTACWCFWWAIKCSTGRSEFTYDNKIRNRMTRKSPSQHRIIRTSRSEWQNFLRSLQPQVLHLGHLSLIVLHFSSMSYSGPLFRFFSEIFRPTKPSWSRRRQQFLLSVLLVATNATRNSDSNLITNPDRYWSLG